MNKIQFNENGDECVIPSGKYSQPLKHFMANQKYGVMIEHDGGGYGVSPAIEGRFINYFDFKAPDRTGRFVYLRDQESGKLWNMCRDAGDRQQREVRFGLGRASIATEVSGIKSQLTITVPEGNCPVELWEMSFVNTSSVSRKLAFFPCLEFFLGGGMALWDEPEWYTQANFNLPENLIEVKLYLPEKERDNEVTAFMVPFFRVDGWCCSKADFLGNGGWDAPDAACADRLPSQAVCGEKAVGVIRHEFKIDAGAELKFCLLVGCADSEADRKVIMSQFLPCGEFKRTVAAVEKNWRDKTSFNYIRTSDPDLDRWTNIWLKYQQIQSVRWGGGVSANSPLMGFRDMLQHAAGAVFVDPAESRNIIVEALHYQYAGGRAVRQWSRHGKHDVRDYRDSPLWIVHALDGYLKETGDLDILEQQIPFLDQGKGAVSEHLCRALDCLWNDRGRHGLSRIGEGDWLDPLNRCGTGGHGESIWLSMALIIALEQAAELYDHIADKNAAAECRQRAAELRDAIERHGWDGQWYLRAYDDLGHPVGSSEEGRIYLNPQSWAVMSGCTDRQRSDELFKTVDERLKTPYGYMLYSPRYEQYSPHLGNISILQLKDVVYSHANAFKIFADCIRGDGNSAYATFKMICPENPDNHYLVSGAEPHIIPNGYRGTSHNHPGQVLYSGFSGTFSWLLRGVIEQIMGAQATYDGLCVAPCLPDGWTESVVARRYRDAEYQIQYRRVDSSAILCIKCDGRILSGNILPLIPKGSTSEVICEYC
jgi:cellobiose phosphorylase